METFYFRTTSRSWWILETLRLCTFHLTMPPRCSTGIRSGHMLCHIRPSPVVALEAGQQTTQFDMSRKKDSKNPRHRYEKVPLNLVNLLGTTHSRRMIPKHDQNRTWVLLLRSLEKSGKPFPRSMLPPKGIETLFHRRHDQRK
ncbi:uncharacterized protein ACNLHF_006194 isoform 1-T1 [Anomaloglossus baeobatrachus]